MRNIKAFTGRHQKEQKPYANVSFRMDYYLYRKFLKVCDRRGLSIGMLMTQIITKLIEVEEKKYNLKTDDEVPTTEKGKNEP